MPISTRRGLRLVGVRASHVHWFRYVGEDLLSAHNLYRCRCGVVKPGL